MPEKKKNPTNLTLDADVEALLQKHSGPGKINTRRVFGNALLRWAVEWYEKKDCDIRKFI